MSKELVEMPTSELRKRQVILLREFDELCRANGIKYALGFGTLLGAVRHQGFIPWDDDIDVAVPRPDYERLVRLADLVESPDRRLRVNKGGADRYPYPYAKFEDRSTVLVEHSAVAVPLGVNIDVFPIDACPRNAVARWIHLRTLRAIALVITVKGWRARPEKSAKDLAARILQKAAAPFHPGRVARLQTRVARLVGYDRARFGGVLLWGPQTSVPLSWWDASSTAMFEGTELPAPANAHEVLAATYGDYMQLPPIEKRITHHDFTAYYGDSHE